MLKKVLIVEDSALLRAMLRSAIKDAGYLPYEAHDGRYGLMSAREVHPDLILLDLLMPVMDGKTMYEELRKEEWGRAIPVVLLTSSEAEDAIAWMAERGLASIKKGERMAEEIVAMLRERLGTPE